MKNEISYLVIFLGNFSRIDGNTLGTIISFINTHETICQLKHIASQGYNDKLCIFGPLLDVIGHDGDVLKVQGRVNLVHDVQRGGLVIMQSKDQGQRREGFLSSGKVGNILPGFFWWPHAEDNAFSEGVQGVHQFELSIAAQRDHLEESKKLYYVHSLWYS